MLEFLIGFLYVLTIILAIITLVCLVMWLLTDLVSSIKCIVFLILTLVSTAALTLFSINLSIVEARSTIKTFQEIKEQKQELGDNYVIEPSILKRYGEALETIEKYKSLGLIKD